MPRAMPDSEHGGTAVNIRAPVLRVLHTVRSLRVDGVVKVILRNLEHFDRTRFEHHLCALRDERDLAAEFSALGIEPIFLSHTGPATLPRTLVRLRRLIATRRIDVVHCNRTSDLGLAGTAARLQGVPVLSTLHWLGRLDEHPEDQDRRPWITRWAKMHAVVALNRILATRIVAVSAAVQASYASIPGFPADRLQVIYPGIDMRKVSATGGADGAYLRRALGLGSAQPVLLNIGRLDPVKGQPHLIPMMRHIRRHWPHAKLLIAGEGALREALAAAIAADGLQENVVLLGQRDDVDALLGLCDLLILSSESEAAPLPLFEAMRAGKPIVATDVGGVGEIVQPGITGLIVPRADPNAMAEAVMSLLSKPAELQRMGEAGRRVGWERFDVEVSVRAIEDLYCTLG